MPLSEIPQTNPEGKGPGSLQSPWVTVAKLFSWGGLEVGWALLSLR